eukprot:INCI9684.1.p1 GENE.INCI9684.1~~INCI9684.1.p1  ORF type:complete len:114 (+),score=5.46 INCI9684.1:71-412(+)
MGSGPRVRKCEVRVTGLPLREPQLQDRARVHRKGFVPSTVELENVAARPLFSIPQHTQQPHSVRSGRQLGAFKFQTFYYHGSFSASQHVDKYDYNKYYKFNKHHVLSCTFTDA